MVVGSSGGRVAGLERELPGVLMRRRRHRTGMGLAVSGRRRGGGGGGGGGRAPRHVPRRFRGRLLFGRHLGRSVFGRCHRAALVVVVVRPAPMAPRCGSLAGGAVLERHPTRRSRPRVDVDVGGGHRWGRVVASGGHLRARGRRACCSAEAGRGRCWTAAGRGTGESPDAGGTARWRRRQLRPLRIRQGRTQCRCWEQQSSSLRSSLPSRGWESKDVEAQT